MNQGRRPGLYPLLHELKPMTNGRTKPPTGTYRAFSAAQGVGPAMSDLEVVTFFPVCKTNLGHIKITCTRGHYKIGQKYRFRMELIPLDEEDDVDS